MLRTKRVEKTFIALLLCGLLGSCATPLTGTADETDAKTEESGMTLHKEAASQTLYLDALDNVKTGSQKFTTVRRGDFIMESTISAKIVYPKQKRVRYSFPYGNTYFIETVGGMSSRKKAGDVIAHIYVAIDEIQIATLERQMQRMEERGETGNTYEDYQKRLEEMQKALSQSEIVMEEDGILLEQDSYRGGTQISSYSIVVADPSERLLEVSNENKQFRFGQTVKVSAKIDGVTHTGTGTVITASAGTISEELAGTTAHIRLDEESEYLYDGTGIMVTVETVHMEDVLLLDASAAYIENGKQMAKVMDENGLHAVTFSFGRKSSSVYWVIDGLEEGDQILIQ